MFIDENVKKELLTFNDNEPIFKQFERKCATLTELSGVIINPDEYQLQYELHCSSIDFYIELQNELYKTLYEKYPYLEFGMCGRLKSLYSHYEKVIRKSIESFERGDLRVVNSYDIYALKVFTRSVNYTIDKVSFDSEGIYIDSGADEFRITPTDVFEFNIDDHRLELQASKSEIKIIDGVPSIITSDKTIPLNQAIAYKRSNKEDIVKHCYDSQKDIEAFFNSKSFTTKKRKDYIANPKQSGYSSYQSSFYSEELGLGIECQNRTQDMENFSNMERKEGYKPNEAKISSNSLSRLPRFVLSTRFKDSFATFPMTDAECFEYIYGMSLQEYRKQMQPKLVFKDEAQPKKEGDAR